MGWFWAFLTALGLIFEAPARIFFQSEACERSKWLPLGFWKAFKSVGVKVFRRFGDFWHFCGTWPGARNRLKIASWPQMGRQEAMLYQFLSRKSIFSLLGSNFHWFLKKQWWKKYHIFSKMRAIFSTWRRLKTMHRRSVLSTFHFFCFTKINENMIQKTEQNWYLKKHRKMKPEGSQNGSKIAENWWGKYIKYWKLRPKHENWGCVFWMIFWHTATIQKILEKRPERRKSDRPGGMSKPLGRIIGGF